MMGAKTVIRHVELHARDAVILSSRHVSCDCGYYCILPYKGSQTKDITHNCMRMHVILRSPLMKYRDNTKLLTRHC